MTATSIHHRFAIIGVLIPLSSAPAPAAVTLVGSTITVASSSAFWPAAGYNPFSDQYLVLWVDVADANGWQLKGRRIDPNSGNLLSSAFYISSAPTTVQAIIGQVTYNSVNHEWFFAYQGSISGGQDDVLGQRMSSDGTMIGGFISLVVKANYQNDASVAYDSTRNHYCVAWKEKVGTDLQIFCRLFDALGSPVAAELRLSEVDNRGKYSPKVAYNPVVDEFMIIWQDYRNWPGSGQDNDYSDIYGQRLNPNTGTKIGANIAIYAPLGPPYAADGQDIPGGIACNTQDGHYAIGAQKLTAAQGYTTVGLVVDSPGVKIAPVFNLSRPNFGAQPTPAYNPASNTWFISYEGPTNVAGKEISAAGSPLGAEENIITTIGSIRDNVLTIRPGDGQYLQVAINDSGGAVYAQRFITGADVTPPAPVTNLIATGGFNRITLSWTNPNNSDFTGTMIRSSTTGFPSNTSDGDLVINKLGSPAAADSYVHTGLLAETTYYYTLFAHDGTPNYAAGVTVSAKAYYVGDFDHDADVDSPDFAHLQICFTPTEQTIAAGCEDADLNDNGFVDQADFALFLTCLNGADQIPGCS